jgi:hypothetical protein
VILGCGGSAGGSTLGSWKKQPPSAKAERTARAAIIRITEPPDTQLTGENGTTYRDVSGGQSATGTPEIAVAKAL